MQSQWPPGGNRGDETRNVILAVVVSISILIGFDLLYVAPQRAALQEQQQRAAETADENTPELPALAPATGTPAQNTDTAAAVTADAGDIIAASAGERLPIEGGGLIGSLSLRGARLDDLSLSQYREFNEPDSPLVALLRPDGAEQPFFARLGWSAAGDVALPDQNTEWRQISGDTLAPGRPVVLAWDNGAGLRFEQEWILEDRFLFQIKHRVRNQSGAAVEMAPWTLVARVDPPPGLGFFILHEGPIAWLNQKLQEPSYEDLEQPEPLAFDDTARGWLGFTDKYWMAAIIAGDGGSARFLQSDARGGGARYQADLVRPARRVEAGETFESVERVFAGAKEVRHLDALSAEHGIDRFDLAVDFGWLYFLTKPLFYGLDWFNRLTGNFGVAILLVTVVMRLLFFPLANHSFRTMARMRKIQPRVLALREQHGDDKQQMQKEMMALYRSERVNPLAGCLPILLQIPVFFALYKVLFVTIEMRHAPFYGWIKDLSAPDPTTWVNLFGLLPFDRPALGLFDIFQIGVGPILMGLTMMIQMRLNPPPPDPVQAKIFAWMPVIFTFFLASFPAGLIVYWTWNNALSIVQQSIIMKRAGVPVHFHLPGRPPPKTDEDSGDGDGDGGGEGDGDDGDGDGDGGKSGRGGARRG